MKDKSKLALYIGAFVMLVHVSGMIGLMTEYRDFFINLTAVNLIFTFGIVVFFHEKKTTAFWVYLVLISVLGFLLEVIGVNTGFPFGEYSYGFPFGPQMWDTPPVIGLNWFVLTYGFTYLLKGLNAQRWIKALVVGMLVTSLDVIIEPVAIDLGYWTWATEHVPIQNYITWFLAISVFSFYVFHQEKGNKEWHNLIVKWVIAAQIIYFAGVCTYVMM